MFAQESRVNGAVGRLMGAVKGRNSFKTQDVCICGDLC